LLITPVYNLCITGRLEICFPSGGDCIFGHQARDKRPDLGEWKGESRSPQGFKHSPTRPGGCRFRKIPQIPGVIPGGGAGRKEPQGFLQKATGKKGWGRPQFSKPAIITVA